MIDLTCCLIALPFLLVGTLLMTIITRLISPGPVFFRQKRVGHCGNQFYLYKFRTMRVNASTAGHEAYYKALMSSATPMQKLDARGDSRLIPLGWLLRASGLDELPQIINVLRGDMSLVGPRPCLPCEYEAYAPWQRHRFDATPGLTGLWQVSGKNNTTFDEMIRLDIRYARTLSLLGDLKIIAKTAPALLHQISETRAARRQVALAAERAAPRQSNSPGYQLKSS
jgi:lipopolysaccharide/colanic/teichoic acid biosynthesis glycosyltransferase